MAVIALCSAKGSPGVTTTALAVAWVWPQVTGRRVLLVEADAAGGGIGAGYLRAAAPTTGGLLAVAASRDADLARHLVEQAVALDDSGQRLLLLGVAEPTQARPLGSLWPRLARGCQALDADGTDVLIDLGRITGRQEATALLDGADVTVAVLRSSLASVVSARPLLRELTAAGGAVSVLVVGDRHPYSAREVGDVLGCGPVAAIAEDAGAARVFSDGEPMGWRFPRSALVRSARAVATQLAATSTHVPAGPLAQVAEQPASS